VLRDLTRGPARLCEAFAVDRALDGLDLTRGRGLWIGEPKTVDQSPIDVLVTPRVGVTSAHDLPLRFAVAGSPFVSGRRIANPSYLAGRS
jgi:DNA-3-methyladenine glycosylase